MNEGEKKLHNALTRKKWKVYRNGWPDFLVIKIPNDPRKRRSAMAIEFKNKKTGDKLSPAQKEMHEAFKILGIPIHVMDNSSPAAVKAVERKFLELRPVTWLQEQLEIQKRVLKNIEDTVLSLEKELEEASLLFEPSENKEVFSEFGKTLLEEKMERIEQEQRDLLVRTMERLNPDD